MNYNLQVSPNVSGNRFIPTTSGPRSPGNKGMNGALLSFSTRTSTCEPYRGKRKKKRSFLERSSSLRLFTRKPYPVKKPQALTRDGPLHRGNLQIGHMCFLFYRTHSALWLNIQKLGSFLLGKEGLVGGGVHPPCKHRLSG